MKEYSRAEEESQDDFTEVFLEDNEEIIGVYGVYGVESNYKEGRDRFQSFGYIVSLKRVDAVLELEEHIHSDDHGLLQVWIRNRGIVEVLRYEIAK